VTKYVCPVCAALLPPESSDLEYLIERCERCTAPLLWLYSNDVFTVAVDAGQMIRDAMDDIEAKDCEKRTR